MKEVKVSVKKVSAVKETYGEVMTACPECHFINIFPVYNSAWVYTKHCSTCHKPFRLIVEGSK